MSAASSSEPSKPICFVLMPIADLPGYEAGHFGRVYEHLFKPAILNAGYTPIRADDAVKTDYIVVGIIQKIVESQMVLCDFSGRNPNVMYELGIRHAFNKPVVLVKDRRTDKIFDIQGLRFAEYDDTLRVDSVGKDIGKIAAAIAETSQSSEKDTNSIVQLAGIKTAEMPAGQMISADTELLLAAIGSLERRIANIEETPIGPELTSPAFFLGDRQISLKDGEVAEIGRELFIDGVSQGTLIGLNRDKDQIVLRTASGTLSKIGAWSRRAIGLDTVPF